MVVSHECIICHTLTTKVCTYCSAAGCCKPSHLRSHLALCFRIHRWMLQNIKDNPTLHSRALGLWFQPQQESFQFAEIYYWKMNYDRSPIPVVYNRILPMHIVHHKVVKPGPDNETLTSPMEIWYSESAASDSHPPNKAVENLVPNNNKTWYGDLLVLFFAAPDMSAYRDASYSDRHNVSNFIVRRGPPKGQTT